MDEESRTGGRPVSASKLIHGAFNDDSVEELYQRDCQQSKECDCDCFFAAVFLVAVHSVASVSLTSQSDHNRWQHLLLLILSSSVALLHTCLWLYVRFSNKSQQQQQQQQQQQLRRRSSADSGDSIDGVRRSSMAYAAWLSANVLIVAIVQLAWPSRVALTWFLLVNFLTCITLPLRLPTCLTLTSAVSVVFLAVSACNAWNAYDYQPLAFQQQVRLPSNPFFKFFFSSFFHFFHVFF